MNFSDLRCYAVKQLFLNPKLLFEMDKKTTLFFLLCDLLN